MVKKQVAGAIILDTLRDRVISGRYLGFWKPGDRLPSIREIAETEDVDRKTAAAAYRRLHDEGLVEVKPRSGVYLAEPIPGSERSGPLERLHRQWLQHTYESARELGLDTRSILQLIGSVSEIERMRVPVVECNWAQADSIAADLQQRLNVQAIPYLLGDLSPGDPMLNEVPVLVTTPYHAPELRLLTSSRKTVIEVTIAPTVLDDLRTHLRSGRTAVLVPNRVLAAKMERALAHSRLVAGDATHRVVAVGDDLSVIDDAVRHATHAFLWPGTSPSVETALPSHIKKIRPSRIVSDEALVEVQTAVLDTAIRKVKDEMRKEKVRVG